jgi:glycine dehydrogenase subunit 1
VKRDEASAHPYMANSVPAIKQAMLAEIGANSIESLFKQIPDDHRFHGEFDLPPTLSSEVALKRHLVRTLARNRSCEENISFLGAGIYQHHVPAICDEIAGRSEFLTSVWGTAMSDHGRNQAWFEFCSQLGELVGMEFVGLPVYSWGCAAGNALRMASRITRRRKVLVPASMDPERLAVVRQYCEPPETPTHIAVETLKFDPASGLLDLADLRGKLSDGVAAVYVENPSYFGIIESQGAEIAALAHEHGALVVVGVDPITLGILSPPSDYGADIVVGTTQTLGAHMNCGGGAGGFIASRDEEAYAREYPSLNISITGTSREGEYGFGLCLAHQSSYGMREEGKDWTGNSVYLTAIANAVYMTLMGPEGFRELGEVVVQRANYAARQIGAIDGVEAVFSGPIFKEFVVRFDGTGKSVAQINAGLLERGIFGGKDLSADFPDLGQAALYCVTEIHIRDEIDQLVAALKDMVAS